MLSCSIVILAEGHREYDRRIQAVYVGLRLRWKPSEEVDVPV